MTGQHEGTAIPYAELSPELQKAVRKLERLLGTLDVQKVLSLDPDSLAKRQGVGRTLLSSLGELQRVLGLTDARLMPVAPLGEMLAARGMILNTASLTEGERKSLEKVGRLGVDISIAGLIAIENFRSLQRDGVGRASVQGLSELCACVRWAVRHAGKDASGRLLVLTVAESDTLDWPQVESLLIEDLERFLLSLDDDERMIARCRWGFLTPERTLEELSQAVVPRVTRERIRQRMGDLIPCFLECQRIRPLTLREILERDTDIDLAEVMPRLSDLFDRVQLFWSFLECCAQIEAGTIAARHLSPHAGGRYRRVSEAFFSQNPAPAEMEAFLGELQTQLGLSAGLAGQALEHLLREGFVVRERGGLAPRKMRRKAAVAHVLLGFPAGLPWRDIALIVNGRGLSSLPEDRLSEPIFANECAYFSNSGCYRHLRYMKVDVDEDVLLQQVRDQLKVSGEVSANLPALYERLAPSGCGYYELRYFVMQRGEEYGLYFDGRSNVDSVSLRKDGARVDLRGAVIHRLEHAAGPLTIGEIASGFRSRSMDMAQLILYELTRAGKVVRTNESLYTTPEKAFAGVDSDKLLAAMDLVVREDPRPLHVDYFRERLNAELGLTYSMHLWYALATHGSRSRAWHVRRQLVSRHPIPYSGLREAQREILAEVADRAAFDRGLCVRFRLSSVVLGRAWHQMRADLRREGGEGE